MKNHPKFEIFQKYIDNSDIFISLPFYTFVIFCPEILGTDRYNYDNGKKWEQIEYIPLKKPNFYSF